MLKTGKRRSSRTYLAYRTRRNSLNSSAVTPGRVMGHASHSPSLEALPIPSPWGRDSMVMNTSEPRHRRIFDTRKFMRSTCCVLKSSIRLAKIQGIHTHVEHYGIIIKCFVSNIHLLSGPSGAYSNLRWCLFSFCVAVGHNKKANRIRATV